MSAPVDNTLQKFITPVAAVVPVPVPELVASVGPVPVPELVASVGLVPVPELVASVGLVPVPEPVASVGPVPVPEPVASVGPAVVEVVEVVERPRQWSLELAPSAESFRRPLWLRT